MSSSESDAEVYGSDDHLDNDESSLETKNLFPEQIVETAILNWVEDCPNVPQLAVSKLLPHFHEFYPDLPKTAKTLLKQNCVDVTIEEMHHGRYVHFNCWVSNVSEHIKTSNLLVDTLNLTINIDRTPLFRDSIRFHTHPILVKL